MRHRRALFLMLPLLAGPLTAQQARSWGAVDSLAQRLIDGHYIPGVALAVVNRDGTLHELAAGYADIDSHRPVEIGTPFYIASSTKSFTALATALLAKQGLWSLTDPISRYLPGVRWHSGVDPSTITLEALLDHTSGLDNSSPVVLRAAFTGDIDRAAMLRALGYTLSRPTVARSFTTRTSATTSSRWRSTRWSDHGRTSFATRSSPRSACCTRPPG